MIMTDNYEELRDLSARALGWIDYPTDSIEEGTVWHTDKSKAPYDRTINKCDWNPIENDSHCCLLMDNLSIGFEWMMSYVQARDLLDLVDLLIGRVPYSGCYSDGQARRIAVTKVAAELYRKSQ